MRVASYKKSGLMQSPCVSTYADSDRNNNINNVCVRACVRVCVWSHS